MSAFKKFLISTVVLILFSSFGYAQSGSIADQFSDYNPNSKVKINHQPLTDYLETVVLVVGRSNGFLGNEKPSQYLGSRIKTGKPLAPSRFEGSRLLIHAFTEDHINFFKAYQQGLENLSTRRSLSTLNKSEQMAFLLNLYNVIVINKLVAEYPVQNLKSFRSPEPGKTSFWTEKVTSVEGVPLSLTDIEKILFTNFNTPLVAFGLWQGSIGGPRLLDQAFTGENVRQALENNAVEFVNSNRGLRPPKKSSLIVSKYYQWVRPAFGTSEDHILMFIREYADPNFVQGVQGVSSLKFNIYNWTVADLIGGAQHVGTSNQLGGVLNAGSGGFSGFETLAKISVTPGSKEGSTPSADSMGQLKTILGLTPTGATEGIGEGAIELLMGIKKNSQLPIPVITTTECAPDEACEDEG